MEEFSKYNFKSKLIGIIETQPQWAPNWVIVLGRCIGFY